MEVLIAIMVLAIGIISVISLFPVGVQQVRQAVQDTRSTIVAINADSTLRMFDWANDPFLLDPPARPTLADPRSPTDIEPSASAFSPVNSVFANMYDFSGTMGLTFTTDGLGYPIYVDPVLANAAAFQATSPTPIDFKRVAIREDLDDPNAPSPTIAWSYENMGAPDNEFANAYHDLPIYSVSDVQLMPNVINAPPNYAVDSRSSFLRHWFYSDADLGFETLNPTVPANPSRGLAGGSTLRPWEYYQSIMPPVASINSTIPEQARATAVRDLKFSWAFVVTGRPLQNVNGNLLPSNTWKRYTRILVFFQRNLADPYRLVRGCFFNGSNVATISWPANPPGREISRPNVRRGTWLMEYVNTGPNRNSASGIEQHRIDFHRVIDVADPYIDPEHPDDWMQTLTLERAVSNAFVPSHARGNLRQLPDRLHEPIEAGGQTEPYYFGSTTTASMPISIPQNAHVWTPVIIWDGLVEVFEVKD